MSGGKGSKSQTVTQTVDVPSYLQPLAQAQARTGQNALGRLSQLVNSGNLVAGFNPLQEQAFNLAQQFASGATPFLPTAQNTFLQAAQGQGLESFLPSMALNTLQQGTAGGGVPTQAFDALGNVLNAEVLPGVASDALTGTARGDFLFGGQGFDEAVQAAVRAAQPSILSTFGRGGAGAATGGLAQAAIGQAATDAFARQFSQERANQLSAANALGQFNQQGLANQMGAAGLLGNLGIANQAQQLQAAGMLGDLSSQERGRQLQAAGMLPQLGLLGSDVLSRIGGQQQALAQQQLSAPLAAQQQLIAAAGGGIPLGALLGSTQSQPLHTNTFGNILGGAATGFEMFGPLGALGGGLLGGLFG